MVERPMTNDELKVWLRIKERIGKSLAITRDDLKGVTGFNERLVRDIIRTLRLEFGKLICSKNERPGGYFMAETIEDLKINRDTEARRVAHVGQGFNFFNKATEAAESTQSTIDFGD